jgi:hypothetical protein
MCRIHLRMHRLAELIMQDILHGNRTVSTGGVPSRNSLEHSTFNFSTFNAMRMNLSITKIDRLVWSADFFGSILFLVSGWLAYGEVASALTSPKLKSLTWWVVLSNLLGSIAFGVSAITSFVLPSQGEMINANVTNLFTALGGVSFFVGALLQLLETNHENAASNKDTAGKIRISTQGTSNLVEGQL